MCDFSPASGAFVCSSRATCAELGSPWMGCDHDRLPEAVLPPVPGPSFRRWNDEDSGDATGPVFGVGVVMMEFEPLTGYSVANHRERLRRTRSAPAFDARQLSGRSFIVSHARGLNQRVERHMNSSIPKEQRKTPARFLAGVVRCDVVAG